MKLEREFSRSAAPISLAVVSTGYWALGSPSTVAMTG
jgi:hypothetical protein